MRKDDAAIWLLLTASMVLAYGVFFAVLKFIPEQSPPLVFAKLPADYMTRERLKELVDKDFPAVLSSDGLERAKRSGKPLPQKFVDFKTADLDGDGTRDDVIAVYSDGVQAAARLFHKENGALVSIDPESMPELLGSFPTIRLEDVAGDPVPEIIVYLLSDRGEIDTWVYQFQDHKLISIGPSSDDPAPATLVHEGVFLDVTRDGKPELIDRRRLDKNNVPYYQVYRFDEELGKFAPFRILRNLGDVG